MCHSKYVGAVFLYTYESTHETNTTAYSFLEQSAVLLSLQDNNR